MQKVRGRGDRWVFQRLRKLHPNAGEVTRVISLVRSEPADKLSCLEDRQAHFFRELRILQRIGEMEGKKPRVMPKIRKLFVQAGNETGILGNSAPFRLTAGDFQAFPAKGAKRTGKQ